MPLEDDGNCSHGSDVPFPVANNFGDDDPFATQLMEDHGDPSDAPSEGQEADSSKADDDTGETKNDDSNVDPVSVDSWISSENSPDDPHSSEAEDADVFDEENDETHKTLNSLLEM